MIFLHWATCFTQCAALHLHKEVCQASQQVLLGLLEAAALGVLQNSHPEGLAEVQGLQH